MNIKISLLFILTSSSSFGMNHSRPVLPDDLENRLTPENLQKVEKYFRDCQKDFEVIDKEECDDAATVFGMLILQEQDKEDREVCALENASQIEKMEQLHEQRNIKK